MFNVDSIGQIDAPFATIKKYTNGTMEEEMKEIHALSIKKALTPEQWKQQQESEKSNPAAQNVVLSSQDFQKTSSPPAKQILWRFTMKIVSICLGLVDT